MSQMRTITYTVKVNTDDGKKAARDVDRRHQVGKNQHAILSNLSIGNAFHAAQHSIEKHNPHANPNT